MLAFLYCPCKELTNFERTLEKRENDKFTQLWSMSNRGKGIAQKSMTEVNVPWRWGGGRGTQ